MVRLIRTAFWHIPSYELAEYPCNKFCSSAFRMYFEISSSASSKPFTGTALWKLLTNNFTVPPEQITELIDTERTVTIHELRQYLRRLHKVPRMVKLKLYVERENRRIELKDKETLSDHDITNESQLTVYAQYSLF